MDYAACSGQTALMFSHECKSSCTPARSCDRDPSVLVAKSLCAGCPVIAQCRFWSIVTALPAGIAGGLTVKERRRVRRKLNQAAFPYKAFQQKEHHGSEEE
jgi:WhiB family redox-sensing transcriptional regulator